MKNIVLLASGLSAISAMHFYSTKEISSMLVTDNKHRSIVPNNLTATESEGTLIFSQHGEATCTATLSTAAGYVLGGCIAADNNKGHDSLFTELSILIVNF